jgi:hypothetical protein
VTRINFNFECWIINFKFKAKNSKFTNKLTRNNNLCKSASVGVRLPALLNFRRNERSGFTWGGKKQKEDKLTADRRRRTQTDMPFG